MEKKNYLLYDMQEKKRYPPMDSREAVKLIGCSRASIYLANRDYKLIFGRWHVVEWPGGEEPELLFPEEWDKERFRILNLRK